MLDKRRLLNQSTYSRYGQLRFSKKNATVVAFLVLGLCDVFQSHRERF